MARLIGEEAARRNVKAYVRLQQPWYECSEKGLHDEKEDVKPHGIIGTWWHESLRILGAIEGCVGSFCVFVAHDSISLNLVIMRIGLVYGPYIDFGLSRYLTLLTVILFYMGCSDKRANCGCRVRLHEEAHEIFVGFLRD